MKFIITFFIISSLISCSVQNTQEDATINWISSQVLCVHWSEFAQNNFETQAIAFEITYNDSIDWSKNKLVFYDSYLSGDTLNVNFKKKPIKKNKYYKWSVFIHSDLLKPLFRKGTSYYNDDCFQIELANIAGDGKLILVNDFEKRIIKKSPNFSFTIGLKNR
jgi:hypothetical protein